MSKILVTPRSITRDGHPALDRLRGAGYEVVLSKPGALPKENELIDLLSGCVGYLAGVEKISATVLKAATDLKVISRNGVGIDNIDLAAAESRDIRVIRAESANSRGVAELTVALMLSLARSIVDSRQQLVAGNWHRRLGVELHDRTLGLVGFGQIGRIVSEIAAAMGMKVFVSDPYIDASVLPTSCKLTDFEELISQSQVVSLHCPPPSNGLPLIGESELQSMSKGALLVNTARSALVDNDAILAELEANQLGGFATDVFDAEPPTDHPLFHHSRVVLTPHIGGYTRESVDRAVQQAVDNLLSALGTSETPVATAVP